MDRIQSLFVNIYIQAEGPASGIPGYTYGEIQARIKTIEAALNRLKDTLQQREGHDDDE